MKTADGVSCGQRNDSPQNVSVLAAHAGLGQATAFGGMRQGSKKLAWVLRWEGRI